MFGDKAAETAFEAAFKAYHDELTAKGQKPPQSATELFTPEHLIGLGKHLTDPQHKFNLGQNVHIFLPPDKAKQVADWLKSELDKDPTTDFSKYVKKGASAEDLAFLNYVAPRSYETYIKANPITYLNARSRLKDMGADTSFEPDTAAVEADIRTTKPHDYEHYHLKYLKDPQLLASVASEIVKSERGAYMVLREHQALIAGLPDGQNILNQAIKMTTGLEPGRTDAVAPGSLKIEMTSVRYHALGGDKLNLYGLLREAAMRDPLVGISYAADNYPKDSRAIDMYLAALPRAHELLDNPAHGQKFIQMLNALEPSQYAGETVRLIPEKDVFQMLRPAKATQLYDLITQQSGPSGYEYTLGTYNAVLNTLFDRMKSEGKSLSDIAGSSPEREKLMLTFMQAAAACNRMDDVIRLSSPEDRELMARTIMSKGEHGFDMTTASQFIKALPKNSPLLGYIEGSMISRAATGTIYDKADMGLLGNWYAKNSGHTPSADNQDFFRRVTADESFQVKPLSSVKAADLLDPSKRNYQLHVFYNDKDGQDSFNSMTAALRGDGFVGRKQGDFYSFTKERNGRSIEILISPPDQDGKAVPAIQDYVASKGGQISVLTGRGHSHHMATAIEAITPSNKIVSLGGCWGHAYVTSVLERASDAHILSTSGVGRMAINNATMRWLNDQILAGRDIDWRDLQKEWDRMAQNRSLAQDLKLYVTPDKNIMFNFERKRDELYRFIEAAEQNPDLKTGLRGTFMHSVLHTAGTTATVPPVEVAGGTYLPEPARSR